MKWYWWVLIAIVIAIIVGVMVRNNKKNQEALALIASNTANDGPSIFNPFELEPRT